MPGGAHLREGEEQGEVAVDAVVALQHLGRLDPLPGGGELDQDALLADPRLLVQGDQPQRLRHLRLLVEGEPRVDLRGHAALHNLQDLGAETHKHLVHGNLNLRRRTIR